MSHILHRTTRINRVSTLQQKGKAWRNPVLFDHGYVRLLDVSGNRVSTPDHADFGTITTALDVRALLFREDWADGALRRIVGQRTGSTNRGWSFYIDPSGELGFNWSEFGTGDVGDGGFEESTVNLGSQPDNSWLWCRCTFRSGVELGFYEVVFYTSSDPNLTHPEEVSWTQLGTMKTQPQVEAIFNSTADMIIGAIDDGSHMIGRIGYVEIRNGLNGRILANPDFRWRTDLTSPTTFTDSTGKVWTVNPPSYTVMPFMGTEGVFTPPPFRYPVRREQVVRYYR